jgi:Ca2+-binding EF-hand superfamily protein
VDSKLDNNAIKQMMEDGMKASAKEAAMRMFIQFVGNTSTTLTKHEQLAYVEKFYDLAYGAIQRLEKCGGGLS